MVVFPYKPPTGFPWASLRPAEIVSDVTPTDTQSPWRQRFLPLNKYPLLCPSWLYCEVIKCRLHLGINESYLLVQSHDYRLYTERSRVKPCYRLHHHLQRSHTAHCLHQRILTRHFLTRHLSTETNFPNVSCFIRLYYWLFVNTQCCRDQLGYEIRLLI